MAVTINASTSNGLIQTADTSGNINIQSNGTTVLGVTSTGVAVTGTLSASGLVSTASLGSGTASSSTYLRGDQTWATNVVQTYLITSSVDISLAASTISGTTGQSGQSSVGSSFTMDIPATGFIVFGSVAGRFTNDANALAHNATFGIRIGTTNYWFGYSDTTASAYSYTTIISNGALANTATNFYGSASGNSQIAIDVVSAGVPTGSQTVQLIAAMTAGTAGTLNGTARQTRVKLITYA